MESKSKNLFIDGLTERIERGLVLNGMTIRALSKKIGYSYEGTRNIIAGEGSYIAVHKVSQVLGIEMKELLKERAGE
jgi:glutamate/tyrosine decarboxylase-like PLP-dependent enzyme